MPLIVKIEHKLHWSHGIVKISLHLTLTSIINESAK